MTRREQRIRWVGFDDRLFALIGIPLLAIVAASLNYKNLTPDVADNWILNYTMSLSFAIINWVGFRSIFISFRKKFPEYKDFKRRLILTAMVSLIYFVVANVGWGFILEYIYPLIAGSYSKTENIVNIAVPLVMSVMMISIYEVIYFNARLHMSEHMREQSITANTLAQLNTLKNQSKPHFLFNSLNTLRYVIAHESSEKAQHFVDELASVYRYIIGTGDDVLITLKEELEFVISYLFIQNERFGENLQVHFNVPDKFGSLKVAPMSIQQLIENAIKHNVVSSKKPLQIHLNIENDYMVDYIVVSNLKDLKSVPKGSTKTGLQNIRSRYKILSDHEVIVEDHTDEFVVKIPLLSTSKLENLIYEGGNH